MPQLSRVKVSIVVTLIVFKIGRHVFAQTRIELEYDFTYIYIATFGTPSFNICAVDNLKRIG